MSVRAASACYATKQKPVLRQWVNGHRAAAAAAAAVLTFNVALLQQPIQCSLLLAEGILAVPRKMVQQHVQAAGLLPHIQRPRYLCGVDKVHPAKHTLAAVLAMDRVTIAITAIRMARPARPRIPGA